MFLTFGSVEPIASSGLSMALGTIVRSLLRRPYNRPRHTKPEVGTPELASDILPVWKIGP